MKAILRTDPGKVRDRNQDAALVLPGMAPLYAVADGMGGHRGGDVASAMAIEGLRELENVAPTEARIRACFSVINERINTRQGEDETLKGMGTTLTMLWETENSVLLGHVGDSRAYLYRGARLYQVSRDHSLVGELLQSGVLDEQEARSYPYRDVVTRAVGTERYIRCDTAVADKLPGDRWLLCSDGLTEYVTSEEILAIMSLPDMEQAADAFVQAALSGGGQDNVTLILLEVAP